MDYQLQSRLIEFVRAEGRSALNDEAKVNDYLKDKIPLVQLRRLLLVLSCDVTKDFIEKAEGNIGRTEINNLIMTVVRNTGLKVWVTKDIIAALFDSIGISFDRNVFAEQDPVVESFQLTQDTIHPEEEKELLDQAGEYFKDGMITEASEIYEKLVKAGSSEAMYQLAIIYLNDREAIFGKKKNISDAQTAQVRRAMQLLQAAAEDGHTMARAELGNYHFEYDKGPEGLKKAFAYYSSPGIPSTDTTVRERLCAIYNQEKTNFILLIISGVLLISMWVFSIVCPAGIHTGSVLVGWGIAFSAIATLIYGFALFCFIRFKYIYLKFDVGVMSVLWLIYPLILAIN